MFHWLKLDLVIYPRSSNATRLGTGARVFDFKSWTATIHAIEHGCYGRHGKLSYFLEGSILANWGQSAALAIAWPEGETIPVVTGLEQPEPPETEVWEQVIIPLYRKIEGELYCFLPVEIRRMMMAPTLSFKLDGNPKEIGKLLDEAFRRAAAHSIPAKRLPVMP